MRTRTKSYGTTHGSVTSWFDGSVLNVDVSNGSATCTDGVLPRHGYLDIQDYHRSGGTVTGPHYGSGGRTLRDYTLTRYWDGFYSLSHLPVYPALPPDLGVEIISRTNPSKPLVQLPVALFELVKMPIDYLNGLYRRQNPNLWSRFEWETTRTDLQKLFVFFPQAVASKMKEIKRLRESGFEVKKIRFCKTSESKVETHLAETLFGYHHVREETRSDYELWGYCRWQSDYDPTLQTDLELISQVNATLLGFSFQNAIPAFWEALPWSWLIDWFTNLGSILGTLNNSFGASPTDVCICESHFTHVKTTDIIGLEPWKKFTPFEASLSSKSRRRISPHLAAQLPVLTSGQLSIITSLVYH